MFTPIVEKVKLEIKIRKELKDNIDQLSKNAKNCGFDFNVEEVIERAIHDAITKGGKELEKLVSGPTPRRKKKQAEPTAEPPSQNEVA